MIARQASSGHDTVNVGMMLQLLDSRDVEDAEEADLGAEMLRVRGNFDQGLGAAAEKQPVDHFLFCKARGANWWGSVNTT